MMLKASPWTWAKSATDIIFSRSTNAAVSRIRRWLQLKFVFNSHSNDSQTAVEWESNGVKSKSTRSSCNHRPRISCRGTLEATVTAGETQKLARSFSNRRAADLTSITSRAVRRRRHSWLNALRLHVRYELVGNLGQHLLGQHRLAVRQVAAVFDEVAERHELHSANTTSAFHDSCCTRFSTRLLYVTQNAPPPASLFTLHAS